MQESKRGVGLQFGPDITKKFLDDNGLKLVVRSHEVRWGHQGGERGGWPPGENLGWTGITGCCRALMKLAEGAVGSCACGCMTVVLVSACFLKRCSVSTVQDMYFTSLVCKSAHALPDFHYCNSGEGGGVRSCT